MAAWGAVSQMEAQPRGLDLEQGSQMGAWPRGLGLEQDSKMGAWPQGLGLEQDRLASPQGKLCSGVGARVLGGSAFTRLRCGAGTVT